MHARFRAGEKLEITSKAYLSLSVAPTYMSKSCDKVIKLLKDLEEHAVFLCYTANEDLEKVKKYIKEKEIPCDKINENVDYMKAKYDNSGKLYYNVFLDDKAGLGQTYRILRKFLKIVRQNKKLA